MPRIRSHYRRNPPPRPEEEPGAKVVVLQPAPVYEPEPRKPTIGEQIKSVLAVPPKKKRKKTSADIMADEADKLADVLEAMK